MFPNVEILKGLKILFYITRQTQHRVLVSGVSRFVVQTNHLLVHLIAKKADITKTLDEASKWSEQNNRPIFLGEFGAYSKGDMDSRIRWTSFVRTGSRKAWF